MSGRHIAISEGMPRFAQIPGCSLLAALAMACGAPVQAPTVSPDSGVGEGTPDVQALLDDLTQDYVDVGGGQGKAIGLVVGVATLEGRQVLGFGATEINGDTAPDADSIFDIASVTKVYTGYLLARAIENGEVRLSDTLESRFDAAPNFLGQSITLLDLATHTSGLPNYPDNLESPGPVNPAAGYSLALLESFLASYSLTLAPGENYEYSNLGSGILGHLLVVASGEASFEALVQREIAEPFGLTDTVVVPSASQEARKLQGHARGQVAPALDIGGPLQGGGALRSTGDEVLRFVEGAISGTDPAWAQVIAPRRESPNGMNASTGFLINVENTGETEIFSKNGGAPGFSSQIVFSLNPPAAVVLLSNTSGTRGLYDLGKTILQELETTAALSDTP